MNSVVCFSSLQAIQQQLRHGKVPCLCAIVKAFSLTEADASVLLKDPTGALKLTVLVINVIATMLFVIDFSLASCILARLLKKGM